MSSPLPGPVVPVERPRPRRGLVVGVLVVILLLVLTTAGISSWLIIRADEENTSGPTPSPSQTGPLPATDPDLSAYYGQELRWKDCGRNECAGLRVPLDYAKPDGAQIKIAVLKVAARSSSKRIGALVVNPGGPGGSGTQYAAAASLQFGTTLTRYFDIVGFDPRGVGASQPLKCLSTAGTDELVAFDPDPDTPAEVAEMNRLIRGFGQACLSESGALARHVSTKEAARDMDILRAALGQPKLDYFGASYGTFLGATYAELFPKNVGRFVLDGAVDPSLSTVELGLEQARGFEVALRAYVADCVQGGGCFLGRTVDDGIERIQGLLDQLDERPLPGKEGRPLTEGLGLVGLYAPLYVKAFWPGLTQALKDAFAGDGEGLVDLADLQLSREDDGYDGNLFEALNAVNCLDRDDAPTTAEVPGFVARYERAAPTFGRPFAFSAATCASWPVRTREQPAAIRARGAAPIVVIGTTRDPATPLVWAQALAKQLTSGRLITRDGDGHTAFRQGSDCVDAAVEAFLVSGTLPQRDLKCS